MKPLIRRTGGILGTLRAEYRQIVNRYHPTTERFEGDAVAICEQIIDKLWEGDFYRTSLGHFDFFWMRDFGTVAQSLTEIGHGEKVRHTLNWALNHYRRAGDITLCIDSVGNTFNAPAKSSVDALPWLMHSIVVSNYQLDMKERAFLSREMEKYVKRLLDPVTGDLKHVRYAEMRDAVNYDRSAYSLALIGRMAQCTELLGLGTFPFSSAHYREKLLNDYWNGRYFKADYVTDVYSSDSALMPFFLGLIIDAERANKTFDYINEVKLNGLYPLVYCQDPDAFHYRFGMGKLIMPNYTGTTIWTWHGTFYLHLLKHYERAEYEQQYTNFCALIERHKTYPEMLNPDGSWFTAPLYRADPGMVWCALFLELKHA